MASFSEDYYYYYTTAAETFFVDQGHPSATLSLCHLADPLIDVPVVVVSPKVVLLVLPAVQPPGQLRDESHSLLAGCGAAARELLAPLTAAGTTG